ncbi:MAG: hypothetical protein KAQ98_03510 [Bacteriovoracaceae bacterium]|nr:hypothetical protein [Bacteriovoracaceae bacterium]
MTRFLIFIFLIIYFVPCSGQVSKKYSFKIEKENHYDVLHLFLMENVKNPILKHKTDLASHTFKKGEFLSIKGKDYFLTLWNKGAHSERMIIFEIFEKKAKKAWLYHSAWPMSYEIKSDRILVHGFTLNTRETIKPLVEKMVFWP